MGTLIASAIQPYITNPDAVLKLKWPNDILINGQKVCGVLIEMEDDYLLVGIGCNVRTAPSIDSKGADAGRTSTAIALHNPTMLQQQDDIFDAHRRVSLAIYQRFEEWLQSSDSAERIIADFSSNMDYSIQTLRDASIPIHANQVQPLCLNDDGTLKVRYMHNSEDGTLVADYLF